MTVHKFENWYVSPTRDIREHGSGQQVAVIRQSPLLGMGNKGRSNDTIITQRANLIAASPKLAEACEDLLRLLETECNNGTDWNQFPAVQLAQQALKEATATDFPIMNDGYKTEHALTYDTGKNEKFTIY